MKRVVVAASLATALACSKGEGTSSPTPTPRDPNIVNGSEFWPLQVGRRWTLRNEQFPDRITTITVAAPGKLWFEKNHPETYHGFRDTNLMLSFDDDGKWIHWGDEDETTNNNNPDDIRYWRSSGAHLMSNWFVSRTPGMPACVAIPSGDFRVPLDSHSEFQYISRYPTGWEGWSPVGQWWVRWRLIEPDVLLAMWDETYAGHPGAIYEDWKFRRGVGIIEITQWVDAQRTVLLRRVKQ